MSPAAAQEKSLLAHKDETLEYKRQLAALGDKVTHRGAPERAAHRRINSHSSNGQNGTRDPRQKPGLTDGRQSNRKPRNSA